MNKLTFRIAGVTRESIVDGPGIRHTIFFQGCTHACPGCHNPGTWDLKGGKKVTVEQLLEMIPLNPLIDGITFSGGDPFLQAPAAAELAAYFKSMQLNIWVYTGYVWEELLELQSRPGFSRLLHYTDVLVDGPFVLRDRSLQLAFRGSSNQRLIRVAPSLERGTVVEWTPETAVYHK